MVIINGRIVGVHKFPKRFSDDMRSLRRCGLLDPFVSVQVHEGHLQSDVVIDIGRAGLLGTIVMSFPLLTHPARDLFNELILTKSGT